MAANHATNYSYKKFSFCIFNYFETSSTVITLQSTKFLSLVWELFVDDDNGDNEMIM